MPCQDYGNDDCNEINDLQDKVDDLTRMLCSVMTYIFEYEENVQDNPDSDFHDFSSDLETNKGLLEWWKEHQAADKARRYLIQRQIESEESTLERLRKAADALDMEADQYLYNHIMDEIRNAKSHIALNKAELEE
jgi:hypothetical protein